MSEIVIGVSQGAGSVFWTLRRVLMVIVLISSLLVVGTLISDILLVILDPRIKFEARGG